MKVWALLPVQPWDEGKTRLSPVLNADQRAALNQKFFHHVLGVAVGVFGPAQTIVVSRSRAVLDAARVLGAHVLPEPVDGDLNGALTQAAKMAAEQGADAVLSVSCDLPFLVVEDLRAMLEKLVAGGAVIAPDHAGLGTNALLLSPPGAMAYSYGEGSFQRHRSGLKAAGLDVAIVARDGLAYDVDTPSDLARLRSLQPEFLAGF